MRLGFVLVLFIAVAGGIPLAIYMYDMPYENWLALQLTFKQVCIPLLCIIVPVGIALNFFTTFTPPVQSAHRPRQASRAEEPFHLPAEFTQVIDIDNHTKQITWAGRSVLVWKEPSGVTCYREVGVKSNQPIGKTYVCDDDRYLANHMKQVFKRL